MVIIEPVDETLYGVVVLLRNENIVATPLYLDAEPRELRRYYAQVVERYILDCQRRTVHRRHAYETAHLNHIGQQRVLRPAERGNSRNLDKVRAYAANVCAHTVEHTA